jgi:hypothetical protein
LKTAGFSRFAMNQKPCANARTREASASHQIHIISDSFACDLGRRGYAISTIDMYCQIVAHFGRWLARRQVAPRRIRPPHVDRLLQRHLPCHFSSRFKSSSIAVKKCLGPLGAGCPNGFSKPLDTRMGISCGETTPNEPVLAECRVRAGSWNKINEIQFGRKEILYIIPGFRFRA